MRLEALRVVGRCCSTAALGRDARRVKHGRLEAGGATSPGVQANVTGKIDEGTLANNK